MGYALFTARKMSLTTRLNLCNAQIMSNSERANTLTMDIFSIQNKTAMEKANKTLAAQTTYSETLNGIKSDDEEYYSKQQAAEAELNGSGYDYYFDKFNQDIDAVTVTDVINVANKYFSNSKVTVTVK